MLPACLLSARSLARSETRGPNFHTKTCEVCAKAERIYLDGILDCEG